MYSVLQQGPAKANDAADLLVESIQRTVTRMDYNTGQMVREIEPDDESLFWRMMLINNPNFGGAVWELKEWYRLMITAHHGLPQEMADMLCEQGLLIYEGWKYAFASKSSETLQSGSKDAQSSLTQLHLRQHQEKTVNIKDEAKKGLGQAIGLGGPQEQQQ